MTNLQKKFATALATGAVLANAFVPAAFASTDLTISGNGSHSDSDVNVSNSNTTTVSQSNNADVDNNINVNANTGGNTASDNTGGSSAVRTGDANSTVDVTNLLNSNQADVESCGACNGDTKVEVSGNGTRSDNNVDLDNSNNTKLFQTNNAHVDNDVNVNAKTGNNDLSDNTGGDSILRTGDVSTDVSVKTAANANSAVIGGGNGSNGAGGVSAIISGNGSHSDNDIDLDLDNDVLLSQTNYAHVDNDIDVDANTGHNDLSDNTGGDVAVQTGDADATVAVDNMVNFNAADLGNCCFGDLTAKIKGNGTKSDNSIDYDGDNDNSAFQTNHAYLDNDLDVLGKTGNNDLSDNTGDVDSSSDPLLHTGDSSSDVSATNKGGINTYGDSVDFTFDLGDLFNWFTH